MTPDAATMILGRGSRCNRHLQNAISLMAEQLIRFLDLIKLEFMSDERSQIDTSSGDCPKPANRPGFPGKTIAIPVD